MDDRSSQGESNKFPVFFSFSTPARLKSDRRVRVPQQVAAMMPPRPVAVFIGQEEGEEHEAKLSLAMPSLDRDESTMVIVPTHAEMMSVEEKEEEDNIDTERLRIEQSYRRSHSTSSLTRSVLSWLNSPL